MKRSNSPNPNVWPTKRAYRLLTGALTAIALSAGAGAAQTTDLVSRAAFRVCADPANTPMSDETGSGFENRIAELFAERLELPLQYEWFPMATGFVRKTLRENRCDVIIGYAQGHELVLNTNHYYTSSYVIVTRADSDLSDVTTIADPRLKGHTIGVVAGSPPASHLARNGLLPKTKGYQLTVDRRHYSPNQQMIQDLQDGTIDAALMWGPIGGPLAKTATTDLTVTPLLKETLPPRLFYRITMGVRPGELVWKRKLNSMIRKNQADIDAILTAAGVPLLNEMGLAEKVVAK